MTSSFQGGTFDPVRQESFVDVNVAHAQQQLSSLDRYHQALNRNAQTRVDIAGEDLNKLAPFSKQLPEFIGQIKKVQDERRQVEAQEWYFTNGLPQEQLKEYIDKKNGIKKEYETLNDIKNKDLELKEDWVTSERFVNLAPWKQTLVLELEASQRASAYSLAENHELNGATDPTEYNAALVKNRREFLKQFNGLNPALLEQNVYQKMRQVENAHYQNWSARRKKEVDAQHLELIQETAYTSLKNGGGGFEEFSFGLKNRGYLDNEINGLYGGWLENLISTESLTDDQYTAIGEQQIPVRGGKKGETKAFKDHPVFSSMYKNVGINFEKMKSDKYTRETKADKAEFQTAKNDLKAAWTENPETLTPNAVREAKISLNKQFKGKFADDFSDFDELLENFSIEAKALEKQRQDARVKIKNGTFTEYELSLLPPILRLETEFTKAAKDQTNVSPLRTTNLENIESLITNRISNNKTLRASVLTTEAITTTKNQYLQLVDDYVFNGKTLEEAHKAAYTDVTKWWADNKDNVLSQDITQGYDLDKFADVTGGKRAKLAAKKEDIKRYLNVFGADAFEQTVDSESWFGPNANFIGSKEELLRIKKEAGKPGWVPNAKIRYVQKMLNGDPNNPISYLDVVNMSLKQMGEKPVDSTPSFDAAKKLSPFSQGKLYSAEVPTQFARAWGTYFDDTGKTFISEIVPDGAGEDIEKTSKDLNMDPAEIAAGYELNMRYFSNETGDMLLDPKYSTEAYKDYWRLIYKYSGGARKDALENTKRF